MNGTKMKKKNLLKDDYPSGGQYLEKV